MIIIRLMSCIHRTSCEIVTIIRVHIYRLYLTVCIESVVMMFVQFIIFIKDIYKDVHCVYSKIIKKQHACSINYVYSQFCYKINLQLQNLICIFFLIYFLLTLLYEYMYQRLKTKKKYIVHKY